MISSNPSTDLLDQLIQSYQIKQIHGIYNDTLQQDLISISNFIHKLQMEIKKKDLELFELQEQLDSKIKEIKEYDKLFGYNNDMSMKQKKQHSKKCDKDEKKIDKILKDVNPSIKEEYENDLQLENDLIDLALLQNQLQYEIHEHFQIIKHNLKNQDTYKPFKNEILKQIQIGYEDTKEENKNEFFENLNDIIEKQIQVYEIDEKIKKA
jgi:hypothetical protein